MHYWDSTLFWSPVYYEIFFFSPFWLLGSELSCRDSFLWFSSLPQIVSSHACSGVCSAAYSEEDWCIDVCSLLCVVFFSPVLCLVNSSRIGLLERPTSFIQLKEIAGLYLSHPALQRGSGFLPGSLFFLSLRSLSCVSCFWNRYFKYLFNIWKLFALYIV